MHATELIIKNGILLTQNSNREIFHNGLIHIRNGEILFAGREKDYIVPENIDILDAQGGIIMPGLINTHTHIGMILFRTLADDKADRLRKVLIPLEMKYVTPELVSLASLHCLVEMIQGGTSTLADMYYFEEEPALPPPSKQEYGPLPLKQSCIIPHRTPKTSRKHYKEQIHCSNGSKTRT